MLLYSPSFLLFQPEESIYTSRFLPDCFVRTSKPYFCRFISLQFIVRKFGTFFKWKKAFRPFTKPSNCLCPILKAHFTVKKPAIIPSLNRKGAPTLCLFFVFNSSNCISAAGDIRTIMFPLSTNRWLYKFQSLLYCCILFAKISMRLEV